MQALSNTPKGVSLFRKENETSFELDFMEAEMRPEFQECGENICAEEDDIFVFRQKKSKRKIKFGAVSGPMAASKGALSVRQYHETDESKILPTKRDSEYLHLMSTTHKKQKHVECIGI
jgi:hypothetical protein